ncbi:MAG: citramalate synthase [Lentisphaerae bacterium GWF2_45_14]|nr:MAG: citramalate synthase [Lentisphaerae bacterium GWF2_45_14]
MPKDNKIFIYDTTLRDGSQAEGISFSKTDKIRIAQKLDAFGVAYIEGGWPGSNPKDMAFFEAIKKLKFKNSKIAAFGSTRRAKSPVENDANIQKLLEAEVPVTTVFGKAWLLHVNEALRITPDKNLELIADSCAYLKDNGREVIFDAEHFFDGYKDNSKYAIDSILSAANAGASTIVLCDTNGGSLCSEVSLICDAVRKALPDNVRLGIHCHNDGGVAVANSLLVIEQGVRHIQGTINGIGERCGNADLCSIIPSIELKMGYHCLPADQLRNLREVSFFVDDLANIRHNPRLPYVGESAFAHKGGIHVNAVMKNPATYEHTEPESVGNKRRILVSDLSGKDNVISKLAEQCIRPGLDDESVRKILAELKRKENLGYEYEAAEASFALMSKKVLNEHDPFFELNGFRVIVEKRGHNEPCISEATVKLSVKGKQEVTAAEGDGPVNALDRALRKALRRFYPEITDIQLKDYKVRILDGDDGTAAKTRVLMESGSGDKTWGTVGVSENIIEASWEAMLDSIEYILYERLAEKK